MSDYVDTILLEANRKSSPEYRANLLHDNPSTWTNDLGSGVKLDIGDKISVHSSFISEIGNEASTIEIKGSSFPVFKNCSDTEVVKIYEPDGVLGDFSASYTFISKNVQLKDHEINLTQSFYKTTNGEYYITLPRSGAQASDVNAFVNPTANQLQRNDAFVNIWNTYNATDNGKCYASNVFRFSADYCAIKYDTFTTGTFHPSANSGFTRNECINDGKRHTLFVRPKFSNFVDETNFPTIPSRDPALENYVWYKKTKTYDVTFGFNSPANVAVQLTDQMRKITNLSQQNIGKSADNEKSQRQVSLICETNSNELFPCAGSVNFNADKEGINYLNYTHYPPTGEDKAYEANYATIGYKRPELQEEGRKLADDYGSTKTIDGNQLLFSTTRTDGEQSIVFPLSNPLNEFPNVIPTQWEFNETNLLALKKWFETQLIYPELFNYEDFNDDARTHCCGPNGADNISIDKTRWLHFNTNSLDITTSLRAAGSPMGASKSITVDTAVTTINIADKIIKYTSSEGETQEAVNFVKSINAGTKTIETISDFPAVGGGSVITIESSDIVLGSDRYLLANKDRDDNYGACPIFIDFNKDRAEINDGNGEKFEKLRYGFAVKLLDSNTGKHYIGFRTDKYVDGLSESLFNDTDAANNKIIDQKITTASGATAGVEKNRAIGFDKHFNAWGTCAILLYNGDAGSANVASTFTANTAANATGHGLIQAWQDRNSPTGMVPNNAGSPAAGKDTEPNVDPAELAYYRNQIYIGANNPQITFDGEQSRFTISDLHTPEYVGNLGNEVGSASGVAGLSSIQDASTVVYKINKRLRRTNYTPTMMPYNLDLIEFQPNGQSTAQTFSYLNQNIIPYSIMDSHSGITFEDFNVDQYNWGQSLYALMGFSYEQFNSGSGNRLNRFNNEKNTPSKAVTTNATVLSSDSLNWALTHKQEIAFDPEKIGTVHWIVPNVEKGIAPYNKNASAALESDTIIGRFYGGNYFPPIEQQTTSTDIVAENLPRKMLSPIYLVKSDLISPTFLGGLEGRHKLPVIDVVPKSAGYGDYYSGVGTVIFTNTIPRTIQNITTEICDADGTASRVDDASCIIYKIEKEQKSNSVVLNDILGQGQPPNKV